MFSAPTIPQMCFLSRLYLKYDSYPYLYSGMLPTPTVSKGGNSLLRSAEIMGGQENPFSPTGANAFRTTNIWSRSAEFHGNTRRDYGVKTKLVLAHCV